MITLLFHEFGYGTQTLNTGHELHSPVLLAKRVM